MGKLTQMGNKCSSSSSCCGTDTEERKASSGGCCSCCCGMRFRRVWRPARLDTDERGRLMGGHNPLAKPMMEMKNMDVVGKCTFLRTYNYELREIAIL